MWKRQSWGGESLSRHCGDIMSRRPANEHTTCSTRRPRRQGERQARRLSSASCAFRLARSPDSFARDDEFHAAILLFAGGCAVRRDRLALAEACCSNSVGRNATSNEVVANGTRPGFG